MQLKETKYKLNIGERRFVTVVFTDMKGFTSLSSKLDPEEMHDLMNTIFGKFTSIVEKYGGTVEKYIGDALVAIFGAKQVYEDDAVRAINAALEFIEVIERINNELKFKEKSIKIGFRTGINSGLVTVGKRGEYDVVTGNALAIASRLETSAEENSILVSEITKERAEEYFKFEGPFNIKIESTDRIVKAYKVKGFSTTVNFTTGFIDRIKELKKILGIYLKKEKSQNRGIIIKGVAGIGKTRLCYEFLKKLRSLPEYNQIFLTAKAFQFNKKSLNIISSLIVSYTGLNEETDFNDFKNKIMEIIKLSENELKYFYSYIRGELESKNSIKKIFDIFLKVLKSIIERYDSELYSPVIFIDNAHFMDRRSLNFLKFFTEKIEIKPFIIFTLREINESIRNFFSEYEIIELQPLNEIDSKEFIKQTCKIDLEDEQIKHIVKDSNGIPLYIEEFIKYINRMGHFVKFPESLQNLILSSIERYTKVEKEILQKASCFGYPFTYKEIEFIHVKTGGDIEQLNKALNRFVKDNILDFINNKYKFAQDIVEETIYNSILNKNKKIIHRLIGFYLLRTEKSSPLKMLNHFIKAEEYLRAAELLLETKNIYFTVDYLNYIEILLNKIDRRHFEVIVELLIIKYAILFNNGRIDEIDSIIKKLFEIAYENEKKDLFAKAYLLSSTFFYSKSMFYESYFYGLKGLEYYNMLKNENKLNEKMLDEEDNLKRFVILSGLNIEKIDQAGKLLDSLKKDSPNYKVTKAIYLFYTNRIEQAIEQINPLVKDINNFSEDTKLLIINTYIEFLYETGNFKVLAEYAENFLELIIPNFRFYAVLYAYLGITLTYCNEQKEKGMEFLKKAENYSKRLNNDFLKTKVMAFLSEGYFIAGEYEKAKAIANEALVIAQTINDHLQAYELNLIKLLIYLRAGNDEKFQFYLKEASFYNGFSLILDFKYKSLLNYLIYKYSKDLSEKQKIKHLEIAFLELNKKIKGIKSQVLKDSILNIRHHKSIIEEYKRLKK